jgi:hypothetical protein
VQLRGVRRVRDRAEHLALGGSRPGQHGQRLVPVRTSSRPAATGATYSAEPPATVRHRGEPKTPSIPWWSRNVKS